MRPAISREALAGARQLIRHMYGGPQFSTLNELRAHLYCNRDIKDLSSLPPTENAFGQHMLRVLYQLYICKRALATDHEFQIQSPIDYGWFQESGQLLPRYLTQSHSPPNLRRQAACHCQKGRCVKSCPCLKSGPCILVCLCGGKPDKYDRF